MTPGQQKKMNKDWKSRNPDKVKLYLQRYRAKKKGVFEDIDDETGYSKLYAPIGEFPHRQPDPARTAMRLNGPQGMEENIKGFETAKAFLKEKQKEEDREKFIGPSFNFALNQKQEEESNPQVDSKI